MTRLGLALSLTLLSTACGGDDEVIPADARVFDAPAPIPDASTIDVDTTLPDGDTTTDADTTPDSSTPSAPPMISQVAWMPMGMCTAATASDYRVITTATDPDTALGSLTYSGSVLGCTGTIDNDMVTINCPNLAPYSGSVTVMDPEGNSDTQAFTINVCMSGTAP